MRMTRSDIAEENRISLRTVDRLLKEMEMAGRYQKGTITRSPWVRADGKAVKDYIKNREAIRLGIAESYGG